MLTVDYSRLQIAPGDRVLDVGCGAGRHAFEAYRRGGCVVAFDMDQGEVAAVAGMCGAMRAEGQVPGDAASAAVSGDATAMPFADGSFDRVIASEVFEHVLDDQRAMNEVARVLRPGGVVAVTVPSWLPERICWGLSREYHEVPGGHVRIYTRLELEAKLRRAGFTITGHHHAHSLHVPYWWLKCLVGVGNDDHPAARAYHRLLVWDIVRRPAATRITEQALNPLIGKSVVVYATRQPPNEAVLAPPGNAQRDRAPEPDGISQGGTAQDGTAQQGGTAQDGTAQQGGTGQQAAAGDAGKGDPEKTHAAA